jgi:hypothetical protein
MIHKFYIDYIEEVANGVELISLHDVNNWTTRQPY